MTIFTDLLKAFRRGPCACVFVANLPTLSQGLARSHDGFWFVLEPLGLQAGLSLRGFSNEPGATPIVWFSFLFSLI